MTEDSFDDVFLEVFTIAGSDGKEIELKPGKTKITRYFLFKKSVLGTYATFSILIFPVFFAVCHVAFSPQFFFVVVVVT